MSQASGAPMLGAEWDLVAQRISGALRQIISAGVALFFSKRNGSEVRKEFFRRGQGSCGRCVAVRHMRQAIALSAREVIVL